MSPWFPRSQLINLKIEGQGLFYFFIRGVEL